MSALPTLVATPDPQPHTSLPAPKGCSCIFTASTAGFFGTKMQVHKVGDPDCPKHRPLSLPISGPGQGILKKMRENLGVVTQGPYMGVAPFSTPRHKFA